MGLPFFFYGTLLGESDTPVSRWLKPKLDVGQPASVFGRMIAIRSPTGWFPSLVPGGPGQTIRGALFAGDRLTTTDLVRLDIYEGRDYSREPVIARLDNGHSLAAQAYVWRAPHPRGSVRVPHGDFVAFLRERGVGALTGSH